MCCMLIVWFAGAAYASSSASALPSSTFPPSITSFGFFNQSMGGTIQGSSALPSSDGLTAGRGCPVGDAAADRSPVLLPSPPERTNEFRDSMSMPHPLHFQASSTPMVREVLFFTCIWCSIDLLISYNLSIYLLLITTLCTCKLLSSSSSSYSWCVLL